MYEFMCGGVPFGENADDPMNVYVAILNEYAIMNKFSQLKFPSFVKDKEFKHICNLMLTKNIMQRVYKLSVIKKHPWFSTFNWENLINMSIHPPLKPKVKKEDLSNIYPFTKHVKVK